MKSKRGCYIVIAICVSMIFYLVFKMYLSNQPSKLPRSFNSLYLNYELTGKRCNDIRIYNEQDSILLSSLFDKTNKILIFKYSEQHCGVCYDTYIEALQHMCDDSLSNVYIISQISNYRNFIISKSSLKKQLSMYNAYGVNQFCPKLKNINKPFFCVLDKNLIVSDIFIPEKKELSYLKYYLEIMISKVNND